MEGSHVVGINSGNHQALEVADMDSNVAIKHSRYPLTFAKAFELFLAARSYLKMPQSQFSGALQLSLGRAVRGLNGQTAEERRKIAGIVVDILLLGELSGLPGFQKSRLKDSFIPKPYVKHQNLCGFSVLAAGQRASQGEAAGRVFFANPRIQPCCKTQPG